MPDLWIPSKYKQGQKPISVVFYFNPTSGNITPGAPDNFPLPKVLEDEGYQKIVCRTAQQVDEWDKKCREQEKREQEKTDEEREAIEGPIRRMARQELINKMLNSRNAVNREFCRQALLKLDEMEERLKIKRESFQHVVGFEDGH